MIAATLTRDDEVMPIVLANDGPGSGLDADTLGGVASASYQIRVTGTCPAGQSLQGINGDGTVVCFVLGAPPVVSVVDNPPPNGVGIYSSLAIGTDGLPVISYYDTTAGNLKVAKCNDASCEGGDETVTTVDASVNDVGAYSSIAIGRPVACDIAARRSRFGVWMSIFPAQRIAHAPMSSVIINSTLGFCVLIALPPNICGYSVIFFSK